MGAADADSQQPPRKRDSPPPPPVDPQPFTSLETLLSLSSSAAKRSAALPSLIASFDALSSSASSSASSEPPPITRKELNHLFYLLSTLPTSEAAFSAALLKRLAALMEAYGWALFLPQWRAVLSARLAKEEADRLRRLVRFGAEGARPAVNVSGRPKSRRERVARDKAEYADEVADRYLTACEASAQGEGRDRLRMKDAERLPPAPAAAGTPEAAAELALARRASRFLRRSVELFSHFTPRHHLPEPSPAASLTLPFLFASPAPEDRLAALAHVRVAAAGGMLPSVAAIRRVVLAHYGERDAAPTATPSQQQQAASEAEEEAAYANALRVLDAVCADPCPAGKRAEGESALDALLAARIARVERAEALDAEPTLYFIRWLAFEVLPSNGADDRGEALHAALELWEASQVRGRVEWDVAALKYARSRSAKLLLELVRAACTAEGTAAMAAGRAERTSPTLQAAVEVGMRCLPHPLLVQLAVPLLQAVTVRSTNPPLALDLFEALTAPASSTSPVSAAAAEEQQRDYADFTWTANLLQSFTTLFLSAAAAVEPSLPIRLYLSWTASGLSFPVGLWDPLWQAAGRRGDVDELSRLIDDWEETGRGTVSSRIIDLVIRAAAQAPFPSFASSYAATRSSPPVPPRVHPNPAHPVMPSQGRILPALRFLRFFRGRYAASPSDAPHPAVAPREPWRLVPLSAYLSILRVLSRSFADRRQVLRRTWREMLLDGHAPPIQAFNSALAASVWRPSAYFTVRDLDAAGVVYNELIAASRAPEEGANRPQPDRETFSLLLHGFLRVASSPSYTAQRQGLMLEAALRTYTAAAARGTGVRGQQCAKLIRCLALQGRWEDAKRTQEEWWRVLVDVEREWEVSGRGSVWEDPQVRREVREMRKVREEVELMEVQKELAERQEPENLAAVDDDGFRQESPEAFETALLVAAPSSTSPSFARSHPHDTPLQN
ncbi:hypothetical protein JCM10213v2_002786 [Rhodosporidiobolus nylandii]